jgi:hypothetical protein
VTADAEVPVRAAFASALARLVDDGALSSVDQLDIEPATIQRWCAAFRTVQGLARHRRVLTDR